MHLWGNSAKNLTLQVTLRLTAHWGIEALSTTYLFILRFSCVVMSHNTQATTLLTHRVQSNVMPFFLFFFFSFYRYLFQEIRERLIMLK